MAEFRTGLSEDELDRLLRECQDALVFPATPDPVPSLRQRVAAAATAQRILPTAPSQGARSHLEGTPIEAAVPKQAALPPPAALLHTGRGRHEWFGLVAAIFAFALVAALLVVLFRGDSDERRATVGQVPPARNMLLVETEPGASAGAVLQLRPVDPVTLQYLPGADPIALGHHYLYAFSPDGQRIAVVTWPGDTNTRGRLRVIDLTSWSEIGSSMAVDDVTSLLFSADGDKVFVLNSTMLSQYDVSRGEVNHVTAIPPQITPTVMRLLDAGRKLAIYGVPIDSDNFAAGPPHVLLIDLATRSIRADVVLEGVRAWQHQEGELGADQYPYRIYNPALAWDIVRERLYVVHADEERITVVDLANGVILEQADIQPAASVLDRVRDWLVPSVAASDVPWTNRLAVLSPDGSRLYVTGTRDEWSKQPGTQWSEGWQAGATSLGFMVVDTDDLTVIERLDLPTIGTLLSTANAERLILATYPSASDTDGGTSSRDHRLVVLNTENLREIGHLDLDGPYSIQGVSPDGQLAYVSQQVSTGGLAQIRLIVINLDSLAVLNIRSLGGASFGSLIMPLSQ